MLELPDFAPDEIDVRHAENFVASGDADTTGHGTSVANIATNFAKGATYDFYRVVVEDGRFQTSNYLTALDTAVGHGLDVLNVSAGAEHSGCEQNCRLCTATDRVAEEHGIAVVAAAGNKEHVDEYSEVHCPARATNAIAVGGFEVECRAELSTGSTAPISRPAGAYWDPTEPRSPSFCGQRSCTGERATSSDVGVHDTIEGADSLPDPGPWSMECADNKFERPWPFNADEAFDKPDVLAPVHLPVRTDEGPGLSAGTSYAAPIVTAVLANYLSELSTIDRYPEPNTIRTLLETASVDLDEPSPAGRVSVEGLHSAIAERYDL